jgi:amino acid permease
VVAVAISPPDIYISAGDAVASDILVSYPQSTLLSLARVLISLLIAFSYPLQCLPSRASATTLWISAQAACCDDVDPRGVLPSLSTPQDGVTPPPLAEAEDTGLMAGAEEGRRAAAAAAHAPATERCGARLRYVVLTSMFLLGTLTVALTLRDLGVVLAVVGATGSTIVSYILPGAIYYTIHPHEQQQQQGGGGGGGGGGGAVKRRLALALCLAGCVIIPLALGFIAAGAAAE